MNFERAAFCLLEDSCTHMLPTCIPEWRSKYVNQRGTTFEAPGARGMMQRK